MFSILHLTSLIETRKEEDLLLADKRDWVLLQNSNDNNTWKNTGRYREEKYKNSLRNLDQTNLLHNDANETEWNNLKQTFKY